jgi:eukaryotic-like serine/threonine-protein kinase
MRHHNGEILKDYYRIIQYIDKGTFGETYLVEDIQLPGSKRLLKYLSYQTTDIETLVLIRRLFHRESETLSLLGNHDQIPKLYDYFEENQKFYLVQEYIEGINLENELNNKQSLAEKEVIQILHEVLNVLQYLEQNQVIHRDIKPANLMRRESDNKIIMIDFGAVKQVSTLTLNTHGQPNPTIIGTPGYMPEEQRRGKPEYASDICALGMTAIQLLTGQKPINLNRDSQSDEVIWKNLISVNPHLARILTKMVRVSLQERYSTANDVLVDLKPLTFLGQKLIQRYKIISYLGGSGFSHTYSVEDTHSARQNRHCIVKQFILTDDQNLHICNEVRSRLEPALVSQKHSSLHKQVPDLLDNFIEGTTLSLVYEFIDGENLSDKIKTGKHWNEAEITAFLTDVLELLSPIHQQCIIHGDIKPSNLIQRTEDKKFILIDFSKFKKIFTLEYRNNKIVEQPGGTDGYMPFEQTRNQPKPSSDIYALGMTAIQLLTGVHPQDLEKDSRNEVILPNGIHISSKWAKILTKMVRFHLVDRYQSAQEVLKDLKSLDPVLEPPNRIVKWLKKHKKLCFFSVFSIGITVYIIQKIHSIAEQERATTLLISCQQKLMNANYDKAEKDCGDSISIRASKEAYFYLGNVLNAQERQQDAIRVYQIAIDMDKDHNYVDPRVSIGDIYNNKADYKKALTYCQDAKTINPNNFKVWSCLGNAQQGLKHYDDAKDYFEKAITLSCFPPQESDQSPIDLKRGCYLNKMNKGQTLMYKAQKLKSNPPDKPEAIRLLREAINEFKDAINKVGAYNTSKENQREIASFVKKKEDAEKLLLNWK